ncbi:phage virion morphogenesis protein [Bradyrhizobium sp. BR 10289]|uniref:phage virion morphogenesis protein n=1 Tax=Bradyrhizobium sp. BR 10289 TaxID=2749993 RepID=UPI001C64AC90|nr:phage virion morphogenesis protein [Bradyrhizobium sp. BR 10289]MBW7968120.1 phage virion morphogenesis protein [Bradyrhizobium sp. BR 10289]
MSGASFTVDLRDEEAALADLGALIGRLDDPTPAYEDIGQALITSTHDRWERSVAPDGSPWPPSLRVIAHGGKTLILSSRLFRSVTANASRNGVEVGTNVVYAAIHQFGGTIQKAARTAVLHFKTNKRTGVSRFAKPGKADRARKAEIGAHSIDMPARPFLGLDEDDPRTIATIVETYLSAGGQLS